MNALGRMVFVEPVSITTRLRGLADALRSMGIEDLGICLEAADDIERLVGSNVRLRARLSNSGELFNQVRTRPLETNGA